MLSIKAQFHYGQLRLIYKRPDFNLVPTDP